MGLSAKTEKSTEGGQATHPVNNAAESRGLGSQAEKGILEFAKKKSPKSPMPLRLKGVQCILRDQFYNCSVAAVLLARRSPTDLIFCYVEN